MTRRVLVLRCLVVLSIGLVVLFVATGKARGLDLDGPLWQFGCQQVRVVDGTLVCPPSAGFSSGVPISWVRYLQGNVSHFVTVNDTVWFNDSSSELTVIDVGLVPECPSIVALCVMLCGAACVRSRPP